MDFIAAAAPRSIRLVDGRRGLELCWEQQPPQRLTASWLREHCRCAACEQRRRQGRPLGIDINMKVADVRPFGSAGLQFVFSDGHQRGAFPWDYLRLLAEQAPAEARPATSHAPIQPL